MEECVPLVMKSLEKFLCAGFWGGATPQVYNYSMLSPACQEMQSIWHPPRVRYHFIYYLFIYRVSQLVTPKPLPDEPNSRPEQTGGGGTCLSSSPHTGLVGWHNFICAYFTARR